jgi:UrcA family protein
MYFEHKHTIAMIVRGLAFISALALSPSVAQEARPATHDRQMVVHYDDLDISRQAGAKALLYRLAVAATAVCNGLPDLRNLEQMMDYRACKRDAMDRAVALIGAPAVTLLYGREPATLIARR